MFEKSGLKALALRNYRGIDDTLQKIPDLKTFNSFIGANNLGKSTVLSFISKYLPPQPRNHHTATRRRKSTLSNVTAGRQVTLYTWR
jgi:predicted ATPase